jgi:hypothetical protein
MRCSTPSRSPPPLAAKRSTASPGTSARNGKRTSRGLPSSRETLRTAEPSSASPVASARTSTSRTLPPGAWTTTPASNRSPARARRGRAGSAMSGFATVTLGSPFPIRSSRPTATAMIRKVVRLSGSSSSTRARPSPSVLTSGAKSTVVLKRERNPAPEPSPPPPPPLVSPFSPYLRRSTRCRSGSPIRTDSPRGGWIIWTGSGTS